MSKVVHLRVTRNDDASMEEFIAELQAAGEQMDPPIKNFTVLGHEYVVDGERIATAEWEHPTPPLPLKPSEKKQRPADEPLTGEAARIALLNAGKEKP